MVQRSATPFGADPPPHFGTHSGTVHIGVEGRSQPCFHEDVAKNQCDWYEKVEYTILSLFFSTFSQFIFVIYLISAVTRTQKEYIHVVLASDKCDVYMLFLQF